MRKALYGGIQMAAWGIAEAQFSEVVEEARNKGPQTITESGQEVAVVISIEQWKSLQSAPTPTAKQPGIGTLAEIILNSPLRGTEIDFPRLTGHWREVDL